MPQAPVAIAISYSSASCRSRSRNAATYSHALAISSKVTLSSGRVTSEAKARQCFAFSLYSSTLRISPRPRPSLFGMAYFFSSQHDLFATAMQRRKNYALVPVVMAMMMMVVRVIGVVMPVMVAMMVVAIVMMVVPMMIAVPSCGRSCAADCDCADNA